ncbi:MAG: Gfo/Idh/MocA family oxidoreductase [Planctomycetes bacterium]|nr:Gfo/Idh/MocA family oxidoreductase [Planctomycetota bacterium]
MSKRLKVAQIGVGGFGARRRELMRQTGLFELVAAYDLNPEALVRCEKDDGAKPVANYEALLATPGIEAVVISTGAKFHADQVIQAAERGLHVFVEKPLCSTQDEVTALLDVRKKTGVVIGVGHNDHRHDPVALTIKKMIDEGAFGKVATFEETTCHSGGLMIKPGDWRGDPAKNPGGMLFQCGCHALHELMFYFGPITEVSAMMRYDVHTTLTADVALCHLKFASGLIGTLNAYHVSPYRYTLNIFGTKMSLYRNERYFDEGTTLVMQEEFLDGKKQPMKTVPVEGPMDHAGGLRSFYEGVRHGTLVYPDLMDGARAVAVIFAAEESARTGRPVRIPKL